MSHFTVLVIGPNPEKQLAPYHEFECTGKDDEYVQEIDKTEELRDYYNTTTTRRYKDADGNLLDPYEDRFYREPTEEEQKKIGGGTGYSDGLSYTSKDWGDGKKYRPKIHFVPEGLEDVRVPYTEVMSFREYVLECEEYPCVSYTPRLRKTTKPVLDLKDKHKYRYALVDPTGDIVKVITRTNPNSKWDWYQLGGRWRGFFKLKAGKVVGIVGEPGVFCDPVEKGWVDQVIKGHVDFDGMRSAADIKARKEYQTFAEIFGGEIPKLDHTWDSLQGMEIEERRKLYRSQPAHQKREEVLKNYAKLTKEQQQILYKDLDEFQFTEDEYSQWARDNAISTFAIVHEGNWYERGSMGWWGVVSGEKNKDSWNLEFNKLLESLPDETLLSVYDCHT